MKNNRILSYDILRILAIILVILCHVQAYLYINFKNGAGNISEITTVIAFISMACIPIFLMLSGALLLNEDKEFDTRKFYKNSFLFLVILAIIWTIIYGLFYSALIPQLTSTPISMKCLYYI